MSMKNSNDTIGIRNRDLPSCSAVPPDFPTKFVYSLLIFPRAGILLAYKLFILSLFQLLQLLTDVV